MKIVELVEPIATLVELLGRAETEPLLLRMPDGQEFVLSPVDRFDLEVAWVCENLELVALLRERKQETAIASLTEVKQQMGLRKRSFDRFRNVALTPLDRAEEPSSDREISEILAMPPMRKSNCKWQLVNCRRITTSISHCDRDLVILCEY